MLLLVAALSECLKQPQAASQSKTGLAWDARATRSNRLQGAVSSLAADLDFPDTIQFDLLTTGDFLSQHLEVTFDRFTDELLVQLDELYAKVRDSEQARCLDCPFRALVSPEASLH